MVLIVDVERLVATRFPDILFERLGRRLGEEDEIKLAPDPGASVAIEQRAEQTMVSTSLATDSSPSQRGEDGIRYPLTDVTSVTNGTDYHNPQLSARRSERLRQTTKRFFGVARGSRSHKRPSKDSSMFKQIYDGVVINSSYDKKWKRWKGWTKSNQVGKTEHVSGFLNNVVEKACKFVNKRRRSAGIEDLVPSLFVSEHVDMPAETDSDSGSECEPAHVGNIFLRARSNEQSKSWWTVRGFISIMSEDFSTTEENRNLAEYVQRIFGSQNNRRFVLCATLFDTKLRLWKYDRSGPLASKEFDVHENPEKFLRVVVGMALGEDYFLGYDPSIINKGSEGHVVTLSGVEYRLLQTIQLDADIRSRGSAVLVVEDPITKQRKIVKDQWVDVSRETKEFDILKVLAEKQVKNVATCEQYQLVHFKVGREGIEKDTTRNDRDSKEVKEQVDGVDLEIRDHYRVLISPYGHRLEHFRLLRELVCAFRDYFKVIQDLHEQDMVHGDISIGNVILVDVEGELERKGYLIDFDYALLHAESASAEGERTGTLPFMALDVMLERNTPHRYYHDVESLFYVLLWVCLRQQGPNNERRVGSNPLHAWMPNRPANEVDEYDMISLASTKGIMVATPSAFHNTILSKLPAYFLRLRMLLWNLYRIIFDTDPMILTKDGMIVEYQGEPKSIEKRDPKLVFADIFKAFDDWLTEYPKAERPSVKNMSKADSGLRMGDERPSNGAASRHGDVTLPENEDRRRSLQRQNRQVSGSVSGNKSCGEKRLRDGSACEPFPSEKRARR